MFNEAFGATLPVQATAVAGRWDMLYWFLIGISVFFFVLVVGGMIYFAIRYHHGASRKPKYITHNALLEAVWIVLPTILLMVIFGWGYSVYRDMIQAPADAYEVHVIARQWAWNFQYDNGKLTTGELYVPLNKPVKLIMTSEDVIHSFFVPNFRIKQDVVPGMYTSVWFEATIPGKHQIFCAEYCGTSHSGMLGKVVVLNDDEWKRWNSGKKLGEIPEVGIGGALVSEVQTDTVKMSSAAAPIRFSAMALNGKHVFEMKGCVACHSVDGSSKIGPSLKGVFGNRVDLSTGEHVTADENYLRESIENPQAKIVKGFSSTMPTFKGLLSEIEMNSLISYIKSLK